MIASSLATAARAGQDEAERKEMFEIAFKEAARLERLTSDFMVYARPRAPQIDHANVADMLKYVASVARAHAANEGVAIDVKADPDLEGDFRRRAGPAGALACSSTASKKLCAVRWSAIQDHAGRTAVRTDSLVEAGRFNAQLSKVAGACTAHLTTAPRP
jgi:hypothetical protein